MIQQIKKVPITETSYPLTRAALRCDFAGRGYLEEEYFVYGTANVYQMRNGRPAVQFADAPYVNRFLVRRPADSAAASGRVAVEILNATSGLDIDRTWVLCKEQMMRAGDTYIGITSKPSSLRPLHKFDPQRYAELFWSNPNPAPVPFEAIESSKFSGAYEQQSEMGLFWDMLSDLGKEIRAGGSFLGGIRPGKIYLIGWSQSCGYLIRYLNTFAEPGRGFAFDGYFAAGGVRKKTPPLNQYEWGSLPDEPGNVVEKVTVPYIMMQTESENAAMGNGETKIPDSDGPQRMVRTYEVPGATHDTEYSMKTYYGNAEDEFRVGILLDYPGEEPYSNDFPYELAFSAAYAHLCRWAEEGIAPPRGDPIPLDFAGRNIRDLFGNAVGGWRLPPVELPVCTYYPYCTPIVPTAAGRLPLFGCRFPLPKEQLVEMYTDLSSYRARVEQAADRCIAQGLLLAADRQKCIDYCVGQAAQFGLT